MTNSKLIFLLLMIGSPLISFGQQAPTIKSIKIGNQEWTVTNLDVSKFRNGDLIPEAKTDAEWGKAGEGKKPAWCYYDNDPANGAKYGKLYNWYAVNDGRGLAPKGWHIPSDAEWTALTDYLGETAGLSMKSASGWLKTDEDEDGNGNNHSGFAGLPGSYRYDTPSKTGSFRGVGKFGEWWSSSEYSPATEARALFIGLSNDVGVYTSSIGHPKGAGLSVRCLRD